MILKKQLVYPTVFSLLLIGMLFGYQNCSKSKKLQLDIDNSSEYIAISNLRADDLESLFKGLLDQEKKERIDSDNALETKIGELNTDLQNYKTVTNNTLSSLDTKTKALEALINTVNGALTLKITQAEAATKALEASTDVKLINLEKTLKDLLYSNSNTLRVEIQKNTETILADGQQSEINKQKIAEQAQILLNLIKSFEDYRTLVAVTYATKEEVKGVKTLYETLNVVVKNLDLKVDYNATQISERLGTLTIELNNKLTELNIKLINQGKDISLMRSDVNIAITMYKTEIQNQSNQFVKLLQESNTKIYSIIKIGDENLRKELFLKIDQESLALSLYMKKAVSEIAISISMLDKRITEQQNLSAADREKLQIEINNLRQEMSIAIAMEQEARNKMADELKALTIRVQRLELDTKELRIMAELNSKMIDKLGADFNLEVKNTATRFRVLEQDMNAKFAAMKNEFSERLNEVAKKSEQLVRDLGEDVKTQFVKVTTDIALLNDRLTQVEASLKQMIEFYQTDRSKMINFEAGVLVQKNALKPHLINTINALTSVQLRFIQILAPDEKNKDFYDTDMKNWMGECGGNTQASFANVMGMDSFQLLSLEYVKLLSKGVRSGVGESDGIFYSFGALDDGNSLARSIALALTRHTAVVADASCLEKSESWATKILLNDPRFAGLAVKLSNDEELERRIEVLYASFAEVKAPAAKIQSIIENALFNLSNKAQAYELISAQFSMDLITDAWGSMLLTERMKNLSDIEKMQTNQSSLAEEMKIGFKELRDDLNAFKVTTNARLTALESQQGKLTTALKRALDIIITLASRGNHADLVLLSYAAGEPIDYTPQIIPEWLPQVNTVQHFFSSPAAPGNKSDACTGAVTLQKAGAGFEYNNGILNPCWMNFRNFPLNKWQNEASSVWLRVFGSGNVLTFKVDPAKQVENVAAYKNYNYERIFDFRNLDPANPNLKMAGTYSKGVFDVKTPDLFNYYIQNIRNYGGVKLSVTSVKKEGTVEVKGNTFDYLMRLYSPIVFDFIKKGMPNTISKENSSVAFDHFAVGSQVTTGWISGSEAAFLIRGSEAHFNNQKINGSHLFGEGTKLKNGVLAQNGFEALAQFDTNLDNKIDSSDKIFNELSLWFDYDVNGKVDSGEIESLAQKGIAKINLNFKEIEKSVGFNNGNDIRFKSEALSKDDRIEAKVYDIFFSTEQVSYR